MADNCAECGEEMGGTFGLIESENQPGMCVHCEEAFIESRKRAVESRKKNGDGAEHVPSDDSHKADSLLVTTAPILDGLHIEQYLGLVRGGTVRSKHVGSDFLAGVKNIVGGEIKGYTELLSNAREEALYRMKVDAVRKGADAIIGVNFSTSMIDVGAAEITAFGTAVKLAKAE